MKFEYYWDRELFEHLLRYRMRPFLQDIIAAYDRSETMGSPADIQKLAQRMSRANLLTERAVQSGSHGDTVMNSFEQTLNRYDEHFGKMKEYDKQLSAMMEITGNGGPALTDATFHSSATPPTAVSSSHPIDHATGDPLKT